MAAAHHSIFQPFSIMSSELCDPLLLFQIDNRGALKLSVLTLLLSLGLASPISIYSRLISPFDEINFQSTNLVQSRPAFCVEDFSRSWKVKASL